MLFVRDVPAPSPSSTVTRRRYAVGAEALGADGVSFRVWAPGHSSVGVVLEDLHGAQRDIPLQAEPDGYFSGTSTDARSGMRYRFRIDQGTDTVPDPASRFQPDGPHGASRIEDSTRFAWQDGAWTGVPLQDAVLYELHVGTFTTAGTWKAAAAHLHELSDLGITVIEIMPVAEFPGAFGWGYDGVALYAPSHLYGEPDDLRAFVDRAHRLGLGVILDLVYNHLGPDGNYLERFTPRYFSSRYATEWGRAINFDDEAAPVRAFIVENAAYWIGDFHFDGLRLDATQQIFDASSSHILEEIGTAARAAGGGRSVLVTAENESQESRLVRKPAQNGFGLDAIWNDDFHHVARVAVTGRREAYFADYRGSAQEFVSLAKWGFLYQGQRYAWQRTRRGTPSLDIPPERFVTYLQNHDQVANTPTGDGERLHQLAGPALCRALTAFWLLAPGTPLFFQGQEFAASAPFLFFADHKGELGNAVRRGRARFMSQFQSTATRNLLDTLPDPGDVATFRRCQLDHHEREAGARWVTFHRDLLRLRKTIRSDRIDGAVLGDRVFVLRYFAAPETPAVTSDQLILVNLGIDLRCDSIPEPLLAPPAGPHWTLGWSSEDSRYGGTGTAAVDTDDGWRIPGLTTVQLMAGPR
jgi:maltooligosyltrehalose trehalohydrolase